MGKIRVGVIGVGHLGKFHVEKYARMAEADLVGIAEIDPVRREAIAGQYRVDGFEDFRQLIPLVDAVSIVVPTTLHTTVATEFLKNKIDVLIEKPISPSLDEAEGLIRLAQDYDCLLQIGHLERFNPAFLKIRHHITTPLFIESHRLSPFKFRGTDVDVILDLMIHDLDLILHLVGSLPQQVHAVGIPVISPRVDIANVRLQFQNGCVANITASRISLQEMRKMRIFQPGAYISTDFSLKSYTVVRLEPKEDRTLPQFMAENGTVDSGDALEMELHSFIEAVRARSEPAVTGEDGKRALAMALRINEEIEKNFKLVGPLPEAQFLLNGLEGIVPSGDSGGF
ncbi:MAG TPA: Gfo/Idh/MocA family oxidoreductase [Thermodesulfobacteriota bacterium]|nr:Gfo/Idh/MocA family oxidoreductase [Thermodesulfobacteriota bacterium]